MQMKKVSLLTDCIFKSMFKECSEFRELLNEIFKDYFELDLNSFDLTSEELMVINIKDTRNRVDLCLRDKESNTFLNIEANNFKRDYLDNRNLCYVAKVILQIFKYDKNYKKEFKLYQININNYLCEIDEDIINTTKRMYDEKNKVRDEKITIHEIYLGKYKEMDYNNISEKEKNLAMLNCTSIKKMEELAQGSKIRGKIMEKFKKKLSAEEFAEILFDPEEDQEMILNSERLEGIEEGIEKGSNQKQIEIAKKMLDEKIPLESISRLTGLNITEIKKIAK
mgnify:FL=1